jgi:hypothetical protein
MHHMAGASNAVELTLGYVSMKAVRLLIDVN